MRLPRPDEINRWRDDIVAPLRLQYARQLSKHLERHDEEREEDSRDSDVCDAAVAEWENATNWCDWLVGSSAEMTTDMSPVDECLLPPGDLLLTR